MVIAQWTFLQALALGWDWWEAEEALVPKVPKVPEGWERWRWDQYSITDLLCWGGLMSLSPHLFRSHLQANVVLF